MARDDRLRVKHLVTNTSRHTRYPPSVCADGVPHPIASPTLSPTPIPLALSFSQGARVALRVHIHTPTYTPTYTPTHTHPIHLLKRA